MVVYLDIIWLLNFCIDLSLIALTAIVLKRRLSKWRLIVSSLIASSTVLLYFSPLSFFATQPIGKFLFSFLIIFIAFGYRKFRFFLQGLLTFYVITFMVGGGMIGIHYFLQVESSIANGVLQTQTGGFGSPASWLFVLITFPLIWVLSKKQFSEVETRSFQTEHIVQVEIDIGQTILFMKGLIDSGNKLYDPVTKTPVMIIDIVYAQSQIPHEVLNAVHHPETIGMVEFPSNWGKRLRLIPFQGLGTRNQMLLAVKPDVVTITMGEERIVVHKVLIGLHDGALSSEGDFECILHLDMIKNGKAFVSNQAK
ncbi:sigma-E processing peptidase SpoIIGA [Bacillus solimangrovi]|uniref:Sporulation sigma-E factor-processing peptidase n=1 Tax=Bacillus solimangrovi TaxID=1305675 RepID=A0A1E5LAR2_9BACI|nr:sigma-E processing peptidase SpoIIGA [Bacillus solimangrovi]OEH91176.1 sigma-E processing peptidase SpoIIGA [Bacillus solimangrovi]